jgi:hypothetical protein
MKKNQKSLYVDEELWEKAKQKAADPQVDRSLSYVIGYFLRLWILGKVEVDPRQVSGYLEPMEDSHA